MREEYGLPARNYPAAIGEGHTTIYESGKAMLQFTSLWPDRPKGTANSCIFHVRMPREDRTNGLKRSLRGIMLDSGYEEVDLAIALSDF